MNKEKETLRGFIRDCCPRPTYLHMNIRMHSSACLACMCIHLACRVVSFQGLCRRWPLLYRHRRWLEDVGRRSRIADRSWATLVYHHRRHVIFCIQAFLFVCFCVHTLSSDVCRSRSLTHIAIYMYINENMNTRICIYILYMNIHVCVCI